MSLKKLKLKTGLIVLYEVKKGYFHFLSVHTSL